MDKSPVNLLKLFVGYKKRDMMNINSFIHADEIRMQEKRAGVICDP